MIFEHLEVVLPFFLFNLSPFLKEILQLLFFLFDLFLRLKFSSTALRLKFFSTALGVSFFSNALHT